jgi:uncharacterized OB-fold protein
MSRCQTCGSLPATDSEWCEWCADAEQRMEERLYERDEGVATWAEVSGWATHGMSEPRQARWGIG